MEKENKKHIHKKQTKQPDRKQKDTNIQVKKNENPELDNQSYALVNGISKISPFRSHSVYYAISLFIH